MIRKIEIKEVNKLYKEHIKKDFPRIERPPCSIIKNHMIKGYKEGFIYIEKDKELGYAVNSLWKDTVLISLLAVFNGNRGSGVGSRFLKELIECNSNKIIIVEVEKPENAKTNEEKVICEKRIAFYNKQGFEMRKDIDYTLFGFPYYIMIYSENKTLLKEEIIRRLKAIYQITLRKGFQNIIDRILQIK